MFHADLNDSVTFVPAGTSLSAVRSMSRLWPLVGGQPKSLPACGHHRCEADGNLLGWVSWRCGSLATWASPLLTLPPVSVYAAPPGVCQSMRCVLVDESTTLFAVWRLPASSTRGTSHPSSWRPLTSMCCEWSVAIRSHEPYVPREPVE